MIYPTTTEQRTVNIHVSNFLEALTFADEQEVDTAALRADAERIIADFLAAHGPLIAAEDEADMGEGSMAFELGALVTGLEDSHKAPSWASLFAMGVQLRHWCEAQGLPFLSADEIHLEADVTPAQRQWLDAYCARWDAVANDC